MWEAHSESAIRTGRLVVNLNARVVSVDDQPVHLTGKEYGILELLSLRKGATLTKEMFLNHLYSGMDEPDVKIIDVFVCKLRKTSPGDRRHSLYRDGMGPRLCASRLGCNCSPPDDPIGPGSFRRYK
jgi:DNA-binding response OmpR family regulator